MSKVLIVSYSFPPNNVPAAQRPFFFHQYLDTASVVLTSANSDSSLGNSEWANTDKSIIFRTPSTSAGIGQSGSKRKSSLRYKILKEFMVPDKGVVWYQPAIKKANEILRLHPDITHVFSTSPSVVNHLVAKHLKKKYQLKWIADFRDYYFFETIEKMKYWFRKPIDHYLERSILKHADSLVFISNWMREAYTRRYPLIDGKAFTIYNGFDPKEYELDNSLICLPQKLTFFYAGTFYQGTRSPLPLFEILDKLSANKEIDLSQINVDVAGRIDEGLLKKLKNYDSYQCFNFLGVLPRKEVIHKYKSSHVLWLIIGNSFNHYTGVPIKAFEYIGSDRPILLSSPIPSEAHNILTDLGHTYMLNSNEEPASYSNVETIRQVYVDYRDGNLDNSFESNVSRLSSLTRQYQAEQLHKLISRL